MAKTRGENRAKNVEMGDSGRQEITIKGKRYIRDGSWWVSADALAPYGYDPDAAPPEVVEANRMEYARGLNKFRQSNVAAFNDANWQGEAQDAGYGDWRESRRAAMQAYQSDPVRFWQMAANGGGGDLTKQPTQDDLDRFSHWLWITNPANQTEVLKAFNPGQPSAPPPPTQAPPPGPTGSGTGPTTPQMQPPPPPPPIPSPAPAPGPAPSVSGQGGSQGQPSTRPPAGSNPPPAPPDPNGRGPAASPYPGMGGGGGQPGLGGSAAPAPASATTGQASATNPPAPGAAQPGRPSGPVRPGLNTSPGSPAGGGVQPGLGAPAQPPPGQGGAGAAVPPATPPPARSPYPGVGQPPPPGGQQPQRAMAPSPYPGMNAPPKPPRTVAVPGTLSQYNVPMPTLSEGQQMFDPFTGKWI